MTAAHTPARFNQEWRALLAWTLPLILAAVSVASQAAELTVSAAASLTNAFRALAPAFEAQNPGTTVRLNFGASDLLLAQIAKGAPVDVFASADEETMDTAEKQKLVSATSRHDFVANTLVLITPMDSLLELSGLGDLRNPVIKRVALGNPEGVPAGRYAKRALLAAGLWTAVEDKAIYAQNVRQAIEYVARGEVDAGFVYGTDALLQRDRVRIVLDVKTPTPIRFPVAVVATSAFPDASLKFVRYLATPQAQSVLSRFGFAKP